MTVTATGAVQVAKRGKVSQRPPTNAAQCIE